MKFDVFSTFRELFLEFFIKPMETVGLGAHFRAGVCTLFRIIVRAVNFHCLRVVCGDSFSIRIHVSPVSPRTEFIVGFKVAYFIGVFALRQLGFSVAQFKNLYCQRADASR